MNRRLRKKKYLGEFKELGFDVTAQMPAQTSEHDLVEFMGRLIDVVEEKNMSFGGGAGSDRKVEGFIVRSTRGSLTEEDRSAVKAFLASDKSITGHEVGELRDAWHD